MLCGGPPHAISETAVTVRNSSVRTSLPWLELECLSWGLNYSIIHSVSCYKWRAHFQTGKCVRSECLYYLPLYFVVFVQVILKKEKKRKKKFYIALVPFVYLLIAK